MWLPNPQGLNLIDGTQYPMNPKHFASPQGVDFVQQHLQQMGGAPPLHMIGPTAGPYQWPQQATFGSVATATDGTPLGGQNAGALADLLTRYPPEQAYAMIAAEQAQGGGLGAALSGVAPSGVGGASPSASPPAGARVSGGVGGASARTSGAPSLNFGGGMDPRILQVLRFLRSQGAQI